MRFDRFQPWGRACASLLAVAVGVACADTARDAGETSAAARQSPAEATFTSPVEAIPAETIAVALAASRWQTTPEVADRSCQGTTQCDNNTAKTRVALWADSSVKEVDFRAAGSGAILIGKLHNQGGARTRRYNLAPGGIYAVYLMQEGDSGRYEIWEAKGKAKSKVHEGRWRECNHPELNQKWPFAFAVFTTCDHPPELGSSQSGESLNWLAGRAAGVTAAAPPASHTNGPAWFTCKEGCCTADPE